MEPGVSGRAVPGVSVALDAIEEKVCKFARCDADNPVVRLDGSYQ